MRMLEFKVDRQRITKSGDFENIVAGSKGYLRASFVFGEDWSGCKIVAAFLSADGEEYAKIVKNGSCDIPDEVTDGKKFSVRLIGVKGSKYKIETNTVVVRQKEVR